MEAVAKFILVGEELVTDPGCMMEAWADYYEGQLIATPTLPGHGSLAWFQEQYRQVVRKSYEAMPCSTIFTTEEIQQAVARQLGHG